MYICYVAEWRVGFRIPDLFAVGREISDGKRNPGHEGMGCNAKGPMAVSACELVSLARPAISQVVGKELREVDGPTVIAGILPSVDQGSTEQVAKHCRKRSNLPK
jgi:hypothetical protein